MKKYAILNEDGSIQKIENRTHPPTGDWVYTSQDDPDILEVVTHEGGQREAVISHTKREIKDNQRHAAQVAAIAVAYKGKRKAEYPSHEEILEALMEDVEGRPEKLEEVKTKRAEVKAKYPKPE